MNMKKLYQKVQDGKISTAFCGKIHRYFVFCFDFALLAENGFANSNDGIPAKGLEQMILKLTD
jgi:hypothetical protein